MAEKLKRESNHSHSKISKSKVILVGIFLLGLIVTRFWNLESNGVFFWDQAVELSRIHQYYVEKTLTLVGPISEDNTLVYSSLNDYMLMPFAVIGRFDPLSITWGAAFWGFLTAILIFLLVSKINRKFLLMITVLIMIWFPLIEASHSYWNPYLVPFWIAIGLLLFQFKNSWSYFAAGLAFGLSIHNHYLAIIAVATFISLASLSLVRQKKFLHLILIFAGLAAALAPFFIFDFLHPPGLFLTRALYFNRSHLEPSFVLIIKGISVLPIPFVIESSVNFSV